MAFSRNKAFFSPNCEYFAYSSPDGCLKIWETASNTLKQEYTPSSHLSATCSSLAWGPCKHYSNSGKQSKKMKTADKIQRTVVDLQLIAMGTQTGGLLLYSVANADLYTQLAGGHNDVVNGIAWYADDDLLFSCSSDQHIVIWTISTGKIKKKWKADKNPIYSICVIDSNNMLSSSDSILWWNITEQSVIKKFSGHATEVYQLLPINIAERSDSRYFISSAVGDRIINAWQLSEANSKKSVACFCLPDEPECLEVTHTSSKDQPLQIAAVTKEGSFNLYEHVLNGRVKKPLQPKVTIHIASNTNSSNSKPYPIPILSAKFSLDLESCILVYGNFLRPVFERVEIPKEHQDTPLYLIRDGLMANAVSYEEGITKIKQPDRSSVVKHLAPGHMTPSRSPYSALKKRKRKDLDIRELPLQERLNSLSLSKTPELEQTQDSSIKSDGMAHLLVQGLQSQDGDILNTVLQCGDEVIITNTIKQLPIQCINLVIIELYNRLHKREPRYHPNIKWLKGIFSAHLPYLMSCRGTIEYLGRISQLIEARTEPLPKLSRLKCSLETLLHQSKLIEEQTFDLSPEPLVSYQSESSEESDSEEENVDSDSVADHVQEQLDEESNSSASSDSENHMEL